MEALLAPLLALLTAMVGVLVWLIKAMTARTDGLLNQRDQQITRAIDLLEKSVSAFSRRQAEEERVHAKLIERLGRLTELQSRILERVDPASPKPKKPGGN